MYCTYTLFIQVVGQLIKLLFNELIDYTGITVNDSKIIKTIVGELEPTNLILID